jgi:LysM repeat protein
VHVVAPGDSLIAIAQRYGVSVAALKAINRDRYPSLVTNPNLIFPGQRILVPVR